MSRPLRIAAPDIPYHVWARGNGGAPIYRDDWDRIHFLALLERCVSRFAWICHAYCLMGNHYHLVVETPASNLSQGMRQLNGCWAQSFNSRYDRSGHLFQARFSSVLVERDSQLLEVCRYVVLNPVRAGLCAHPSEWPWSSYRATAGDADVPRFLHTGTILGALGGDLGTARIAYRRFVEQGIGLEPPTPLGGRLGRLPFLRSTFGLEPPIPEIPRVQVEPLRRPLDEIFSVELQPIRVAYRRYGYSLREIGEYLGCHYSTISRQLRLEEDEPADLQRKT